MTRPQQTIVFAGGYIEVWSTKPSHVRTVFPDGSTVAASPQPTDEYRARALALGYRDENQANTWHDATHLLVAQLLACGSHQPRARTLHAVANNCLHEVPEWLREGEECLNFALARYLNDGVPDRWLAPLVLAGVDLEELREQLQELMRLGEEPRA